MPTLCARSTRPYSSRPAPGRAAAKGLGLAAFAALALAACTTSTPTVAPDNAGSTATDPNVPAGGKAPSGVGADAPGAGTPAAGTPTAGAPPAGTTAGTPTADAHPAGPAGGGERRAHPEFVQKMIERFQSAPPENPPRTITRYAYKGQTVYYVSAPCCDHQSELYDTQGKLLCAPDGGITGRGDGKCPDFAGAKTDALVAWQDTRRSPGKTPGKTGPAPSPLPKTTHTPPTIPPKPIATQ